jgi:hypothetical protein
VTLQPKPPPTTQSGGRGKPPSVDSEPDFVGTASVFRQTARASVPDPVRFDRRADLDLSEGAVPGAPGAPGTPATALFAGVDSDGTLTAQSGVVGTVSHATNSYTITFNRNVDSCAPVASLTNDDPGEILASVLAGANNTVSVFTFDSAGAGAPGAFALAVFCN